MNFQTHNQTHININRTHGVGNITCTYQQLVHTFGEPMTEGFDDYKSDAEWQIKFDHGAVATVYNYKTGRNYLGPDAPAREDLTRWSVGGFDAEATRLVLQAILEAHSEPVEHDSIHV